LRLLFGVLVVTAVAGVTPVWPLVVVCVLYVLLPAGVGAIAARKIAEDRRNASGKDP
jgi:hypothetical protein